MRWAFTTTRAGVTGIPTSGGSCLILFISISYSCLLLLLLFSFSYSRIIWGNIPSGVQHNFNKYSSSVINHYGLPYDYRSVMHYGGSDFGGGRMTIQTVDPAQQVTGPPLLHILPLLLSPPFLIFLLTAHASSSTFSHASANAFSTTPFPAPA